jgi:hypothetical protein
MPLIHIDAEYAGSFWRLHILLTSDLSVALLCFGPARICPAAGGSYENHTCSAERQNNLPDVCFYPLARAMGKKAG